MNTTDCPKCGFGLAATTPECPRCGLIVSKFRPNGTGATEIGKEPPPYRARVHVEPPPVPGEALASERDDSRHAISAPTVAALQVARPWIRLLSFHLLAVAGLLALAALLLLVLGNPRPPLAVAYTLYCGFLLATALPLIRSAAALKLISFTDSAAAVEEFALELVTFWRRFAVFTALVLIGLFSLGVMSLKFIRA